MSSFAQSIFCCRSRYRCRYCHWIHRRSRRKRYRYRCRQGWSCQRRRWRIVRISRSCCSFDLNHFLSRERSKLVWRKLGRGREMDIAREWEGREKKKFCTSENDILVLFFLTYFLSFSSLIVARNTLFCLGLLCLCWFFLESCMLSRWTPSSARALVYFAKIFCSTWSPFALVPHLKATSFALEEHRLDHQNFTQSSSSTRDA